MKIGYARVSTLGQNLDSQKDQLRKNGCEEIFEEKVSAGNDRPELTRLLGYLRKDDVLMVCKMDRLARSVSDLIKITMIVKEKDAHLIFLDQSIDTTSAQGKLVFTMLAAFSEFERNIIRERTQAGLSAARLRGRSGGRPVKFSEDKINAILTVYDKKEMTITSILKTFNIARSTLYRFRNARNKTLIKTGDNS